MVLVTLIESVYNFLWGDLLHTPLPGGNSLGISLLIILLILRRRKFRQAMARIDQAEDREAISLRYGYARCLLHHSSATAPDGAETAAKLNELALFSEQPMTREQRREMDGFAAAALQACKEKWTLSQKLRYKLWDCLY